MIELGVVTYIDIVLRGLVTAAFGGILVIDFYRSKEKGIRNTFLAVAMIFGLMAMIPYTADWFYPFYPPNLRDEIRIFLHTTTFFLLALFYFTLYCHYEMIVSIKAPTGRLSLLYFLVALELVLIVFHFWGRLYDVINIFLAVINSILDFIGFLLLGSNLQIGSTDKPGLIVTYTSHLTFILAILTFAIAIYLIIKHQLIELGKISFLELLALIIMLQVNIYLLINDFLVTHGYYSLDVALFLVTMNLLIFLVALILLIANYLFSPLHGGTPLQMQHFLQLREAFLGDTHPVVDTENKIDVHGELIVPKISSTSLEILLQLIKHRGVGTFARTIESETRMSKGTISYNLTQLLKTEMIERTEDHLEGDLRFKRVKISRKGLQYLKGLYMDLGRNLKEKQDLA